MGQEGDGDRRIRSKGGNIRSEDSSVSRRRFLKAGGIAGGGFVSGGFLTETWTDKTVKNSEGSYPPPGTFSAVDGRQVHHLLEGTGNSVILIHGDGGSVFDWTYSAYDQIAERFRTIALDRPGFGYSDPPETLGSPFSQAALIHEALTKIGVTDPVLVGHSRGATTALAYAILFPEETAGIVDVAGAPYDHVAPPLHFEILTIPILGRVFAETVYVPFSAQIIQDGIRRAFEPDGSPPGEYLDAYVAMERRPSQLRSHAFDSVRASEMYANLVPQYPTLSCPIAVVHGIADRNVPIGQARRFHSHVDGTRLFEIPGAGHELMFYHPDRIIQAIEWVLESTSV